MRRIKVGKDISIGEDSPCYIIAEIGINHNGSIEMAKQLIDGAVQAQCNAVKFQKRTPELCVPKDQWEIMRDTMWGRMSYIEYKKKIELGEAEYAEIDRYCKSKGIQWFASCWDAPSVDFIEKFNPVMYKMASASLTDKDLILKVQSTGKPLMLSTGMSTQHEIETALDWTGAENVLIAHSTSSYPCPPAELNLRMIQSLQKRFPGIPIGYSGHETGLATTLAALAIGATFVERHFTLDRALWGTDHAASVEVNGMIKLVRDIRDIEAALGDGVKKVYESELEPRRRLRKFPSVNNTSKEN